MNILIIDDSKTISHILTSSLGAYGYNTHFRAPDKLELSRKLLALYRLIIINTNISNMVCTKIVQSIRDFNNKIFILGIHNKGHWQDRIEFLQAGGDDVINYPFPIQEVITRIQVLLRRGVGDYRSKYKIQNIIVDPDKRKVFRNSKEVPLKRKEFSLLEYMVRNKNRALSRSELMDQVWDYKRITGSNTIDVHINRLRKVLDSDNLIETVHGFGYKIYDKPVNMKYEKRNEDVNLKLPLPPLE